MTEHSRVQTRAVLSSTELLCQTVGMLGLPLAWPAHSEPHWSLRHFPYHPPLSPLFLVSDLPPTLQKPFLLPFFLPGFSSINLLHRDFPFGVCFSEDLT